MSTAMSGYTRRIRVAEGVAGGEVTMRANGAEVYPGHVVTCTGQTWPDVALPDLANDSAFGIAGCNLDQDIDTVYADNAEFTVYLCGSGAIVYGYHKGDPNSGDIVAGDILCAYGITATGSVFPLSSALQDMGVADPTNTVIATAIKHILAIVGRAMETQASVSAAKPIKIMLSV